MLDLDHIAITVDNLETAIYFYTKFGYKLTAKFEDDGYRWATLKLNNHSLELFENFNKENLIDAVSFGNKVSSIAVQRKGAQPSIPYLKEVKEVYGDY